MKNLVTLCVLLASFQLHAQFYYKEILGTRETNDMMKKLVNAKVKSISLKSFDADNTITDDFVVHQTITINPYTLTTMTRFADGDQSVFVSTFDDQVRLVKTVDSSNWQTVFSTYEYDGAGNLSQVIVWTTDTSGAETMREVHQWAYGSNNRVSLMKRTRNGVFIDEVRFIYDDNGNPVEEGTYKNGNLTDRLYYYYNDRNQLTDIVSRYNATAKMLMPDYMFEYSPAGVLLQKITVPPKGSDYTIWRFQYDNNGNKIREAIFDKHKQLQGRIDYIYTYY